MSTEYSFATVHIKKARKGIQPLALASFAIVLATIILALACSTASESTFPSEYPFVFQLQDIDIDALAASPYQIVVIDASSDGSESGRFTSSEIEQLKSSDKTVLAYLSIGEAETYRGYWQSVWDSSPPAWLGIENPEWEGNYKVRYWDPEWQRIIMNPEGTGMLDLIQDAGFDGVYLDIVDAYYYWGSEEAPDAGEVTPYNDGQNPDAADIGSSAEAMADFIIAIAEHARSRSGHELFLVCPQNATDIIHDMPGSKLDSWWSAIDAVGAEDTYNYGGRDMDNRWNPQEDVLANLDIFWNQGKDVFCIEYLSADAGASIDRFFTAASTRGFEYYAADRDLDSLR